MHVAKKREPIDKERAEKTTSKRFTLVTYFSITDSLPPPPSIPSPLTSCPNSITTTWIKFPADFPTVFAQIIPLRSSPCSIITFNSINIINELTPSHPIIDRSRMYLRVSGGNPFVWSRILFIRMGWMSTKDVDTTRNYEREHLLSCPQRLRLQNRRLGNLSVPWRKIHLKADIVSYQLNEWRKEVYN